MVRRVSDGDWVTWGAALGVRADSLGFAEREAAYAAAGAVRGGNARNAKKVAKAAEQACRLARGVGLAPSDVRATVKAVEDLALLAARRPDVAATMARDVLSGASKGTRVAAALYGIRACGEGTVPEWVTEAATLRRALKGLPRGARTETIRLAAIERGVDGNVLKWGITSLEKLERMRERVDVPDGEVAIAAASVLEFDMIDRLDPGFAEGIRRDAITGRLCFRKLTRIRRSLSRGERPEAELLVRKEPHGTRLLGRRRDSGNLVGIGPAPMPDLRDGDVAGVVVTMVDRLGGDTVATLRAALALATRRVGRVARGDAAQARATA